jgi:hypothetical protein
MRVQAMATCGPIADKASKATQAIRRCDLFEKPNVFMFHLKKKFQQG